MLRKEDLGFKKGAKESIGAGSKEEILQLIETMAPDAERPRNDEKEAQKRHQRLRQAFAPPQGLEQGKSSTSSRSAQSEAKASTLIIQLASFY